MRIPLVLLGGLVLAGLNLSLEATAQPVLFEEVWVVSPPPVRFGDAAWGDYDRDGDLDLILTGSRRPFDDPEPFAQLYRNDGNTEIIIEDATGAQVEVPAVDYQDAVNIGSSIIESVWQSAVAWGDYDRDGDLDLAVTGLNETGLPTMRIYEYLDDEELLSASFLLPGVRAGDLDWGDYDNDGDADFVVCGLDAAEVPVVTLYENQVDEDAGFLPHEGVLDGVSACTVEWGDYDVDGDLDLLVTGIATPQAFVTRVYRNEGGDFVDEDAGLKGLLYASGAWGDYDADGDLDILLSGARLTPFIMEGQIKVYRNEGGGFTDVSDGLVGSFENDVTLGRYQGAAAWGDFNNSGYLDFLITGAKDPLGVESLQLYQNNRNDRFTKSGTERFDGGIFGGAFWGDYDLDNDLDIFVLGEEPAEGPSIKALRNRLGSGAVRPEAPAGLQVATQGNTATFSWDPGFDTQTPAPGLTYNLRVGTSPGGVDVVSPMADVFTGRRYVSRRGSVGHNTRWTLQNLPPGTYYWSVQAIDNSFSGSAFAPEGFFTIGTNQTGLDNQTILTSGYSFGECIGYCHTELFLDANTMTLVKRSWDPEAYPVQQHQEPTDPVLWQRLTQLIDFDVLTPMQDVLGCPDCADGGAEWVEIVQGDRQKKITFEYDDTPGPIAALLDEIRQLRQQLEEKLSASLQTRGQ